MLDLSYQPKEKEQKMKGSQALSMQNVVNNAIMTRQGSQALSMQNVVNNAIMTRQGSQAIQGGATMAKTDGFGRSV